MKSRFKLGQEIFYMYDNGVLSGKITGIAIVDGEVRYSTDEHIYSDSTIDHHFDVYESSAYPTKEALIKSL